MTAASGRSIAAVMESHPQARSDRLARYCPRCGTGLAAVPHEGRPLPTCPACGWIAFRDPKVVAVAVLEDGAGAVWLIRRAIEPCVGEWALPGGYVDWDEHPRDAAVRECREEIGCAVSLERLVTVEHAAFAAGGVVVVGYAGRVAGGTPHPGVEALEVRAIPADGLPELAFETHAAILRAWRSSRT